MTSRHLAATPTPRRAILAVSAGAIALTLAGCSAAADDGAAQRAGSEPSATADFTPVTVDNCGTKVTVTAPPTRVVTIKSTSTEMLLALGLQDALVGTAFADGPVPEPYRAAYAEIPVLSDKVPGQEALLTLEPDFVYGGWESNFSADEAGDRAGLAALDIATFVSPAACKEAAYQPDPLAFDDVFDEIREVASLFGVSGRAEELIAVQEAALATVGPPALPTTALWYSSGADTP